MKLYLCKTRFLLFLNLRQPSTKVGLLINSIHTFTIRWWTWVLVDFGKVTLAVIEPATFWLCIWCSTHWAKVSVKLWNHFKVSRLQPGWFELTHQCASSRCLPGLSRHFMESAHLTKLDMPTIWPMVLTQDPAGLGKLPQNMSGRPSLIHQAGSEVICPVLTRECTHCWYQLHLWEIVHC